MADVAVNVESDNSENLVRSGMKAFALKDYNGSVTVFSRAIELMVTEHGETHDSLGDVYLYYGKALLEASREVAEPLGDAVRMNMDSDDDEDEEEVTTTAENSETQKNDTKMETETEKASDVVAVDATTVVADDGVKNGSVDSSNNIETTSKSDEKKEEGEVTSGSTSKLTEKSQTDNESEKDGEKDEPSSSGVTSDEKTTEEDKEEPTDLQVAWEVLELAKLIFEQRADVGKKELAETLIVLGEVSMESENFESAIADIKQGLEIQKSTLESDSRNLAETYYKLAIALSANDQIDEAIENLNTSLTILKSKIAKLKEDEKKNEYEITEIQGLIPEIEEKIADMKSYKEEATAKIVSVITEKQQGTTFTASSSTKEATDISHLVKRKRKLDEIVEECEGNPAKKQP